jgi:Hypothetical protein (DUF2513)
MKRDLNLVKEILLYIENSEHIRTTIDLQEEPPIIGYTLLNIGFHLKLMEAASYIKGDLIEAEGMEGCIMAFVEMTWEGHEFLQILKDKETISKIMSMSKDGITNLSFDLIKSIAKKLIETKAEKYLGISNK